MILEKAEDVRALVKIINEKAGIGIDLSKVEFLRSKNARTKAIARTLVLPAQWRFVLGDAKLYIIEVISERYDLLSCEEKIYVILHELMHIPTSMRGLRNHNYKGFRKIRKTAAELSKILC